MLTYDLGKRESRTLYEYLYQCVKEDILSGRLITGEKLPSKRTLARHLEISVVTVEKAYAQLIVEGYIQAEEKRGYYVRPVDGNVQKKFSKNKIPSTFQIVEQKPKCYFDFAANGVELESFPFAVWSRLMRKVFSEQEKGLLEKSEGQGSLKLRRAISDYLYHCRKMSVAPEQIVVGAGAEYLYGLLIQLLGFRKTYALEEPGYQKAARIYKSFGVNCRHIGMDQDGLSVEMLRREAPDVVHISPSHQYPTGVVMPIKRRQEILKWSREKKGRYIIEDDYDSEFRFSGKPVEPLESIDSREKVIYMNTFSRTIAPSIRIGYMVLPPHLAEKYQKEMDFSSCTVPGFEQYTLAAFISQGYFEQHLNRMRNHYRSKRDRVIEVIKASPLFTRVEILGENAGLHFLMQLDTEKNDRELAEACLKEGVKILCLSQFFREPPTGRKPTILVNYPGMDCAKLKYALERMYRVL